jgi:hypothetical protein
MTRRLYPKPVGYIHVYRDDQSRDLYGDGRCGDCGLPRGNRLHRLPERTAEQLEHEARRMGET